MRRLVLPVLLLLAGAAHADPALVPVRTGNHPGFGRIVLDLPSGCSADLRQGSPARVDLRGNCALNGTGAAPRNATLAIESPQTLRIDIAAGGTLRPARIGERLVLDVLDRPATAPTAAPPPAAPTGAATPPAPAAVPQVTAQPQPTAPPKQEARPSPVRLADLGERLGQFPREAPANPAPAPRTAEAPAAPAATAPSIPTAQAAVRTAPVVPVQPAAPVAPVAAPTAAPPVAPAVQTPAAPLTISPAPVEADRTRLWLPFASDTGAAAVARPGRIVALFDRAIEPRPPGTSAPPPAGWSIRSLGDTTIVEIPTDRPELFRLTRVDAGWEIALWDQGTPPPDRAETPIDYRRDPSGGLFVAEASGRVIPFADPVTRAPMLIGTVRAPSAWRGGELEEPDFGVVPTILGLALRGAADQVRLRPAQRGFLLEREEGREAGAEPTDMAERWQTPDTLTRGFGIPRGNETELLRLLQSARASAATAPRNERLRARLDIARVMLALGLASEAFAMLDSTAQDEGAARDDAGFLALRGLAAWLAGRDDSADGLRDKRLPETDELAFWRGLAAADGTPDAARSLAARLPILRAYPATLRRLISRPLAEALIEAGDTESAGRVTALDPANRQLDYARARLELAGLPGDSARRRVSVLDRASASPDMRSQVLARRDAIEERLGNGMMEPREAADRLERLSFAWRGDAVESDLRSRVASLRAADGDLLPALRLLQDTARLFPERRDSLVADSAEVLRRVAAGPASGTRDRQLATAGYAVPDLVPWLALDNGIADAIADAYNRLELPAQAADFAKRWTEAGGAALATATPAATPVGCTGDVAAPQDRLRALLACAEAPAQGRAAPVGRLVGASGAGPVADAAKLLLGAPVADIEDVPAVRDDIAAARRLLDNKPGS